MFSLKYFVTAIIFSVITASLTGCVGVTGPQGPPGMNAEMDKVVRFDFLPADTETGPSQSYIADGFVLRKFNIGNYALVDSATIGAFIKGSSDITNGYGYVELFNLSDSTVIDSSTIKTNSGDFVWLESKNFYKYMPKRNIDLAIRFRTDSATTLTIGSVTLFLYRNF